MSAISSISSSYVAPTRATAIPAQGSSATSETGSTMPLPGERRDTVEISPEARAMYEAERQQASPST